MKLWKTRSGRAVIFKKTQSEEHGMIEYTGFLVVHLTDSLEKIGTISRGWWQLKGKGWGVDDDPSIGGRTLGEARANLLSRI